MNIGNLCRLKGSPRDLRLVIGKKICTDALGKIAFPCAQNLPYFNGVISSLMSHIFLKKSLRKTLLIYRPYESRSV